nr:hypothetical protein [uncultured Desulfobulbus sp.]
MKKLALLQYSFILAMLYGFLFTPVFAGEKVLSIYFAGTGNTMDGAEIFEGFPKYKPELMSALYADDTSSNNLSSAGGKFKYFVDGIGTSGCIASIADPMDTCPLPLCCRGYNECLEDAIQAFDSVGQSTELVLNLIGYSRGGVLPMLMARWLHSNNRVVKKINILTFDPVPGVTPTLNIYSDPVGAFGNKLTLPNNVSQFIGIYARDERSLRFEPIIPEYDPTKVKDMLVSIRGSHETLDGNREIDGHAATLLPVTAWMALTDDRLSAHYRIARSIAERLMSGSEWGNIEFADSVFIGTPKDDFTNFVDEMYAYPEIEYLLMHSVSFLPVSFSTYDISFGLLGRDYNILLSNTAPPLHGRLLYRAPYRHASEYIWWLPPFWWTSPDQVYFLDYYVQPINAVKAWERIEYLRGTSTVADITSPEPNAEELPDINGQCSVTIGTAPTATDDIDGTISGISQDLLYYDQQGLFTILWTYTDKAGNSSSQLQNVIIKDTLPPEPIKDELPTIEDECSAKITIHPMANDNCFGTITGYTENPSVFNEQGTHQITWNYVDDNGNSSIQQQNVIIKDRTPPQIYFVQASPDRLWPPNHKMIQVTIDVKAHDNCDSQPRCSIRAVSSNGQLNKKEPDWRLISDLLVELRAERDGAKRDRQYEISIACTDMANNTATATVNVIVPHDQNIRR